MGRGRKAEDVIRLLKAEIHQSPPGRVELRRELADQILVLLEDSLVPDGFYVEGVDGIYGSIEELTRAILTEEEHVTEVGGFFITELYRQKSLDQRHVQITRESETEVSIKVLTPQEEAILYKAWKQQMETPTRDVTPHPLDVSEEITTIEF